MNLLILGALLSATPTPPPVEEATAALKVLKATLKDTLLKALEQSPEAAIEVCAVRAPALAKEASSARITVGRSALKLRNSNNAPLKPWLASAMAQLSKEPSGTDAHRSVTLPDGTVGYAEAIWVAPMCLTCHGKTLAPTLASRLKATYPKDAALGFELGDFRGVYWAEVKP